MKVFVSSYAAASPAEPWDRAAEGELFDGLARLDLAGLELGYTGRLHAHDDAWLIAQMRPGVDGLTLIEGGRRGTLLPSVWKSVGNAREFLEHLKRKAGLAPNYWSDTIRVERYTAASIGRDI